MKMKLMIVVSLLFAFVSFMAGAKDDAKKMKAAQPAAKTTATADAAKKDAAKKDAAPCDTKEDILKKLEEEKKAREAAKALGDKPKGFSLQGGNTGCAVK